MKIIIDPGHGGKDSGGGSNSYFLEKDMNLKISKYMKEVFLKNYEVEVYMTRESDKYMTLKERGQLALDLKVDLLISNHINSYKSSVKGSSVKGAEVVHSIQNDNKLANMVLDALVERGATRRRTFTKESTVTRGRNWYGILKHSEYIEGIIIEYGFASNEEDTQKIIKDWQKYVEGVVKAVALYLDLPVKQQETLLVDDTLATVQQMKSWAKTKGATEKFIKAAEFYHFYGNHFDIRGDVLYCQAAKETNFGRFTGAVKEEMNNFAGIKIKNPTGDKTEDHESFDTMDDGIRAHFNHMAAYVGIEPLGIPHDRYYVVKSLNWAGTIKYVEQLGGRWAPNPDYGHSIIRDYLNKLLNTKVESVDYKSMYFRTLEENKSLRNEVLNLKERIKNIKNLCEV